MKDLILFIPLLISFFVTMFVLPYWIRKTNEIGLVWRDMNKYSEKNVSGSGGVIVVLGFLVGVLFYVGYRVFYLESTNFFLVELFAMLGSVLLLGWIGFIDDLIGWRKKGLSRRSRIFLVMLAAIPLIAINAGKSDIGLPFIGSVDLGLIYPLIFVPIGVIGATTTFNFLAGFNGLEAGQGVLLLTALGVVALITGSPWLLVISLCMVTTLLAFLLFNFYPAKIFPGDTLTYPVGGLIAIVSILGNFEKIAVFFFIPYFIEFGLKLRGKLKKQSFGIPNKNGELELKYSKIYGLCHFSIFILRKFRIKPTEKNAVFLIWFFQLIIILLGFVIFGAGLFK